MTTALEPELSAYRWSSHDEADRFPVEDPATGEVITLAQGGGTAEVNAAVEAAHRAFQTNWRWRTPAERAALLLQAADVLAEHADELALLEWLAPPLLPAAWPSSCTASSAPGRDHIRLVDAGDGSVAAASEGEPQHALIALQAPGEDDRFGEERRLQVRGQ
jgi:hypothetical protein